MRIPSGGDYRRGLFLALESFAGTAALLLDEQGAAEYGNRSAGELLDCVRDELLAARWQAIAPLFGAPFGPAASPEPRLFSAELPTPAGSRLLSLELHAVDESAGGGHFALLKDCSVLDPLERELLQASERRAWSHRSETLMHDLKGIMNSMQISLELMSSDEPMPADIAPEEARKLRRIATLKEDLGRMNRVLRALPDVEGDADPGIAGFDVRELVKDIFAALRQLVRRNRVELKLELAQAPLWSHGRRPWLTQAVFNVAAHRLNAMPAGGRLVVEAALANGHAIVRISNDVPDRREGRIDESHRLFCLGRRGGGATDLQIARAIFESQRGAMEITSGSADSTVIAMRFPA